MYNSPYSCAKGQLAEWWILKIRSHRMWCVIGCQRAVPRGTERHRTAPYDVHDAHNT